MLPEKRRAYLEKRKRKVQRNRRILAVSVTVVLAMLAVIVLSLTVFFKVDTIKILGDNIYDESQILNESGLKKGDNLFMSNTDAAKQRIEKNLPYISSAVIKRKFPSSIIIEITGTQASCCFKCTNGTAVADSSLKVLELVSEKDVSPEITRVNTKNTFTAGIGENIITLNSGNSASDEIQKEAALVKTVFKKAVRHCELIKVAQHSHIFFFHNTPPVI